MAASKSPGRTTYDVARPTEEKLLDGWEYVTIPAKDPYFTKQAHPRVQINAMSFEPGGKYLVPPKIAETLKDRLEVYKASRLRIMNPDTDDDAIMSLTGQHADGTRSFSPDGQMFAV